jgi:hypothetical protein
MAEVHQRRRESILRDLVLAQHGGQRRGEPRRRVGKQDRVVDEHHAGVAAAFPPRAQEQAEHDRRDPDDECGQERVEDRLAGAVRVAARLGDVIDARKPVEQGRVEVAVLCLRQHRVIDDRGRLVLAEVVREIARARVEIDLAVPLAPRVHVEQDDQAVVDALPADAPRIHDRDRIRPRGCGGDVGVIARPGHDRELRLGPIPNGLRDRLGLADRCLRPDARVVVDVDARPVRREIHRGDERRAHEPGRGGEHGGCEGGEAARGGSHGQPR